MSAYLMMPISREIAWISVDRILHEGLELGAALVERCQAVLSMVAFHSSES